VNADEQLPQSQPDQSHKDYLQQGILWHDKNKQKLEKLQSFNLCTALQLIFDKKV